MKAQAIFIEAGHGMKKSSIPWIPDKKDPGAVSKFGVERDFAVLIAAEILKIIKAKAECKDVIVQGVGIQTSATIQKKMQYVNTVIAENHLDPTLCFGVAIHMNSATASATGFETWYQRSGKSSGLAVRLVESWKKYALTPVRPNPAIISSLNRHKGLYIDDTKARYVLIETGFITNEIEARKIKENIPRVAEAIAHGILEHIRNLK